MKQVIRLKVQLVEGLGDSYRNKKIIRTIDFLNTATLKTTAENIIKNFGFDCDHAFGFYDDIANPTEAHTLFADYNDNHNFDDFSSCKEQNVKKTKNKQVFTEKGKIMFMLFDYGDDWIFKLSCEAILTAVEGVKYPLLVSSSGISPEQYPAYDDADEDEEIEI